MFKQRMIALFVVAGLISACGTQTTPTTNPTSPAAPVSSTPTVVAEASAVPAATTPATSAPSPSACVSNYDSATDYFSSKTSPSYAKEWTVEYAKHYKVVTVDLDTDPVKTDFDRYILVQCGTPAPVLEGDLANAMVVTIPITRVWEGGSSTFAAMDALGVVDSLSGVVGSMTGSANEYLPSIAAQVAKASVIKEASYGEDLELIAAGKPDIYLNTNGREWMTNARQVGIPALHYSPFSESPLGSAEQVKFLALFYNLEAKADAIFTPIEREYLALREKAQAATNKPSVLIGNVTQDGRFGTRNLDRLESVLMRDAGGELVLTDTELNLGGGSTGFSSSIDLEKAIEIGANADFWFNLVYVPSDNTASEFIATNPLNASFSALQKGNSFHRFGRAEDYFSNGAVYVDQLLADAVSILHPELLPDHELVFLKRIPGE
ncbi:MAG TPA: ABC transporter substrate-binding protein [Herpetosiphon sp.]|uniref:Periplasmic binding protein n=1 Tax=Herpetosiphon aurantiacus (strain ATCC 23779 / DSM 785 / 114-95) TaxID=316274 RepID=A9AWA0_HERA2|nr:ABC transporter substrate-binding protein [Herpetosiphon sp.]ABX04750.1 periplasmic binding protein [Herpetosiphon aurantiacus DSM 785]HBW49974.1 ABC transporter substrate-binding protein [Herpetosiphon sp.]